MNDVKMGLTPLEARQEGVVEGAVVPDSGGVGHFQCMFCDRATNNADEICDACRRANIHLGYTVLMSGLTATEYAYQKQVDDTERYWNARSIHGAAAVHSGIVEW